MGDKVLVASNILSEVDGQVYPSHMVHAYRMGRDTEDDFVLFTPRRMAIDNARNQAVLAALQNDCDYVFFYDDDMELNAQTYKTLKSRNKDIIMALCYIRGYPFKPMVFEWVDNVEDVHESKIADVQMEGKAIRLWEDCEEHVNKDGVIENVAAVGCAATLIKVDVFRELEYPYFYTGTANTEDVYFCLKAQAKLPNISICVDTTVPAGHSLKDKDILYPSNAKMLRKFEEERKNGTDKKEETNDSPKA